MGSNGLSAEKLTLFGPYPVFLMTVLTISRPSSWTCNQSFPSFPSPLEHRKLKLRIFVSLFHMAGKSDLGKIKAEGSGLELGRLSAARGRKSCAERVQPGLEQGKQRGGRDRYLGEHTALCLKNNCCFSTIFPFGAFSAKEKPITTGTVLFLRNVPVGRAKETTPLLRRVTKPRRLPTAKHSPFVLKFSILAPRLRHVFPFKFLQK